MNKEHVGQSVSVLTLLMSALTLVSVRMIFSGGFMHSNSENNTDTVVCTQAIRESDKSMNQYKQKLLDEGRTFWFKDYKIDHQGENTIDIMVDYDYKDAIGLKDKYEYPEFTQIYKYIDTYLKNYPNEDDFWEILNKNLTETLLTKEIPTEWDTIYKLNEIVTRLTVQIDVHPTEKLPYSRSSTVTRFVH